MLSRCISNVAYSVASPGVCSNYGEVLIIETRFHTINQSNTLMDKL